MAMQENFTSPNMCLESFCPIDLPEPHYHHLNHELDTLPT